MRIAEIYRSVQGEGDLTGVPSVFVRASGCNLRCWFCDTPYASWAPEGDDLSVEEILERVADLDCPHVVLTGGEPMLFAELVPLSQGLKRQGRHVTIETAATLDLPVACDLMSISPKLENSGPSPEAEPRWWARHERSRRRPEVVRRLARDYPYQFKFVIDVPADLQALEAFLREIPEIDRSRVLLMPQGTDRIELDNRSRWLKPYCLNAGLRFCPRMQIEWFGSVRGT